MTLNTRGRAPKPGPVLVLDAPDGHDVIIEGRLDVHTVPDIRDAIHDVIARGPGELRLHLRDAEIGDATGLGVLVHIHRRASREQRQLFLVDPSDRTARLLRGCRLDRILASRHAAPAHAATVAPLTA
ncbi:anti-sigma factor antagonist [Intrasporangium oryzae NRRL B-24470]|uniref:Anti-sigma factor antagonist n=1 Tax=Intrasporangium oryzae NRRL B-24470 TaxID=1386089 RepID=W9GEI6_9MICO|nr:STAS domain-containing protein [Intrasporangium oryzae]EWT02289.1 anti-sigma factor antagonist [Intrasporangium oryzae NRRL B-24470]